MTFLGFISLGALFVFLLLVMAVLNKNFFGDNDNAKWIFFVMFLVLACSAVCTLNNYLYPKDTTTYTNADYHFLEHLGFSFDKNLSLVSFNPPEGHPKRSFWDDKTGMVELNRDSGSNDFILRSREFYEPLYVSKKIGDSAFFIATNNLINVDVSKGLELKRDSSIKFKMEIVPQVYKGFKFWKIGTIEKVYYISHYNGKIDTSLFDKYITQGYPLMDILQRTPNLNLSDELLNILDGAYIVRKNIHIDKGNWKSARFSKKRNDSPLLLFPKESFFIEESLSVNNFAINDSLVKKEFTDTLPIDFRFFAGMGLSQTDMFKIDAADTMQGITMKYILPKMQSLARDTAKINHVFITSSIKEIQDSVSRTGYLYNIFENDSNFYHFSGKMRYFVGTPSDSIYFEIRDIKSANPLDSILKISNEEFSFSSQSGVFNNFRWLFKIEDMRSVNTLKWEHIFFFIAIFVFLVAIRMVFAEKISAIELSIYIVSLCFGVIRLILTWRMSTFLPIEGIDPARFFKMQNGWDEAIWTFSILILPVLFTIFGNWKNIEQCKLPMNLLKEPYKIGKKISSLIHKHWWNVLVVYVFGFVICGVFSTVNLMNTERFMNIPIPMLMFFIFYNLSRNEQNESLETFQKILLCSVTFVYLAIQDAGFAIIFLLYLTIHFGLVSVWLKKDLGVVKKSIVSIVIISLIILFLVFEGTLILNIFKNTNIFAFVFAGIFIILALYAQFGGFSQLEKSLRIMICVLSLVVAAGAVFGGWIGKDYLNKNKSYIKYRAEVQVDSISKVIQNNEFNSTDIEYIMRSAHNQWFVNEYNAAADSNKGHWTIQPHFNQGSSYTTQTTDLIVVRYILAEHGVKVLFLLMVLLFLLLIVYVFDIDLEKNFTVLGVFILLFSIALFVCLSANNKIVFFGQDFPFLSLTSKIAVFFPISLFILAVWQRIFRENDNDQDGEDKRILKLGMVVSIFILALATVFLPSKNDNKNNESEAKFDISSVINETKEKVKELDKKLEKYQDRYDSIKKVNSDTIWNRFTQEEAWTSAVDTSKKDFYNSLLNHFANKTPNKYDPEELLHLRRRNGYLHLAVNQKYYTIKSFRQKDLQWTGDLLAAKSSKDFSWTTNNKKTIDYTNDDIVLNAFKKMLVGRTIDKVSNLTLRRFDSSWTDNNIPLYLLSGNPETGNVGQCYDVLAENYSKKCSFEKSQLLSVRLLPNDILSLKRKEGKKESLIFTTKYGESNNNYLAKNMWLNGDKRLFYPLGNKSIWTYHFANLINQTYGREENKIFKDSTIRISIDYDLTEKLHSIIKKDDAFKHKINTMTEKRLLTFKDLSFDRKKDANNTSALYYDSKNKIICIQSKVSEDKNYSDLKKSIAFLNVRLQSNNKSNEISAKINEAIDLILEKQYDYSAVVLDGYGRIRSLFDYSNLNKPDPNNIRSFNKLLSDLYKESSIKSEIDYFGNKALSLLVPGPASSFKPIAYTAVTSRANIAWDSLFLSDFQPKNITYPNKNGCITHYGGIKAEPCWSLENNHGFKANDYLIKSDNLYHSMIILLGMQQNLSRDKLNDIFKKSDASVFSYPVIEYKGNYVAFDKDEWFNGDNFNPTFNTSSRPLNSGLRFNFHLNQDVVSDSVLYNAFSDTISTEKYLSILYEQGIKNKRYINFIWAYPTTGSMNNANRNESPLVEKTLIQMSLGAAPLEVSPLQMATFGMRLASLNKYRNITTLSDDVDSVTFVNKYNFFDIDKAWGDSSKYIKFHRDIVFEQLRKVLTIGTAIELAPFAKKVEKEGYYIYAKTGTLNITDKGNERLKHLLVIISNKKMENIKTVEELKTVKYYVLYLSYHGINKSDYSTKKNENIIKAVIESEQFKKYMKN